MSVKVLIAVDSSTVARDIIGIVANTIWQAGDELKVLTIVDHSDQYQVDEIVRPCQLILDERVQALAVALPKCTITGDVVVGSPAETIIQLAREWNVDLIIIGSHGDTGIRRDQIGSVAATVVNTAPCSVEVLKIGSSRQKERLRTSSLL